LLVGVEVELVVAVEVLVDFLLEQAIP